MFLQLQLVSYGWPNFSARAGIDINLDNYGISYLNLSSGLVAREPETSVQRLVKLLGLFFACLLYCLIYLMRGPEV